MELQEIARRAILVGFMLCGLLVIASISLAAEVEQRQPDPGTGTEGVWKTYRCVDGLASDYIHTIVQDREGVFWFGTPDGVSRFDFLKLMALPK
jgi:hypothetical protein